MWYSGCWKVDILDLARGHTARDANGEGEAQARKRVVLL